MPRGRNFETRRLYTGEALTACCGSPSPDCRVETSTLRTKAGQVVELIENVGLPGRMHKENVVQHGTGASNSHTDTCETHLFYDFHSWCRSPQFCTERSWGGRESHFVEAGQTYGKIPRRVPVRCAGPRGCARVSDSFSPWGQSFLRRGSACAMLPFTSAVSILVFCLGSRLISVSKV